MKLQFLPPLLLVLCSCTSLGLAPPQNLQQQIGYAYGGVTAALNTLAQATNAGLLTSDEATSANEALLGVKASLDAANAPGATPTAAVITAATAALANISTYLTCKQQKRAACQL